MVVQSEESGAFAVGTWCRTDPAERQDSGGAEKERGPGWSCPATPETSAAVNQGNKQQQQKKEQIKHTNTRNSAAYFNTLETWEEIYFEDQNKVHNFDFTIYFSQWTNKYHVTALCVFCASFHLVVLD